MSASPHIGDRSEIYLENISFTDFPNSLYPQDAPFCTIREFLPLVSYIIGGWT